MYALTEVLAFVTCTGPAGDLVKYFLIQQVKPEEHRGHHTQAQLCDSC